MRTVSESRVNRSDMDDARDRKVADGYLLRTGHFREPLGNVLDSLPSFAQHLEMYCTKILPPAEKIQTTTRKCGLSPIRPDA